MNKMNNKKKEKEINRLLVELYQICGALNCNAKILDNILASSKGLPLPHKSLLPFYQKSAIGKADILKCKSCGELNISIDDKLIIECCGHRDSFSVIKIFDRFELLES